MTLFQIYFQSNVKIEKTYNFHLRPSSLHNNENDRSNSTFMNDSNHHLRRLKSDQSLHAIYGTRISETQRDMYPSIEERREENQREAESDLYEQNSFILSQPWLRDSVYPFSYWNRNSYGGSQNCLLPLPPTDYRSQSVHQSQTLPRIYMRRNTSESVDKDMNVSSLHVSARPLNYKHDGQTNYYNGLIRSNKSDQQQQQQQNNYQHFLTQQQQQKVFSKNLKEIKNYDNHPVISNQRKSSEQCLYSTNCHDTVTSVVVAATTTPTLTTTICGGSDDQNKEREHLKAPCQIQWPTAIPASSSAYSTTRYCIYEPVKISQPQYTAVVSHALPILTHNGNLYISDTSSSSISNPIANVIETGSLSGFNYLSPLIFDNRNKSVHGQDTDATFENGRLAKYLTTSKTHTISPLSTEVPQVFDLEAMKRERRHSFVELFNCKNEIMSARNDKTVIKPAIIASAQMSENQIKKLDIEGTPV